MTTQEKKVLRTQYPKKLTLNNVRCILHISKRKASWLLANGYIKCKNNGKKTRQYSIDIKDLFEYIETAETLCLPCGIFSSRQSVELAFHLPPPADFAQWLENEWLSVNNLLRLDEVALITGYALSSVQKWTYKKKLQCLWAQAKVLTTKEWLIQFFVSHGHRIIRKSDVHLRLLQKFYSTQ
ncbi:MAG: hypothetical protein IJD77_07390 [Clostridia bacterium]|nr:hypothetical protein [Clostridia bacterium]